MHACGHDFHTAAIIGAAYLLKEKESSLSGTVRFIFQPAEESSNGACNVIEAGHLRGVQAIFGMHNKPDLPVGTIGIKDGPLMAGVDRFEIEIHGVGTCSCTRCWGRPYCRIFSNCDGTTNYCKPKYKFFT